MPRFGSKLPKMEDVFKGSPNTEVMNDLIAAQRLQAIDILQNLIPQKILHVQSLIKQEDDPASPWYHGNVFQPPYTDPVIVQPSSILVDTGDEKVVMPSDIDRTDNTEADGKDTRVGAHWFELVAVNPVQMKCIEVVSTELEDLHMLSQDLKVWLELEIPVVEDGNSFGADVQAHLITELSDVYRKSTSMTNGVRAHHGDRLKLAMDWAKYPNMKDFAAAIAASDRFDHFLLRSYLRSILTLYAGLLTKFERNWSKVINPKGSVETGGMY